MSSFKWHPNEPPPKIEPHSKAKLDVLRRYIQEYFDRLNVYPQREEFRLDLIDGFAGGGTFRDGNTDISGTPLVMLEEAEKAKERLNKKRTKRLDINCKFYFIDKERAHTDHLKKVLKEREYRVDEDRIVVRTGLFEDEIEGILRSIKQRQPRAGRAIFLLDQTGFAQVELSLVYRILNKLATAEVILTFAADALVNHLARTPEIVKAVSPLELTESHISDLIQYKDGTGGRALVQRTLRNHIRTVTGAEYDTPFFIRPRESRRALWFLHLSRHSTARDVMIRLHWDIQNRFEHYGSGDFGMLGWDALRDSSSLSLFQFGDLDQTQMRKQLLNSLPRKLFSLVSEEPVTVDAMRHIFANQTAARFSDLEEIILQLAREKEFQILDPEGKARSRSLKRLKPTDRIGLPPTLLFPGFSRR